MVCAPFRTGCNEAVDETAQTLSFQFKLAPICDPEFWGRRIILAHRTGEGLSFDQRSDQPTEESARRSSITQGHLHRRRQMGEGLGNIHLSPL
jgi:hypothetical protein